MLPTTISRFRNGGDDETADLIETVIYPEEITHCAAGLKWFKFLCLRRQNPYYGGDIIVSKESGTRERDYEAEENDDDVVVIQKFHATVKEYFRGPLKPPFNEAARKAAGFGPRWYEPLAVKDVAFKLRK